MTAYLLLFWFLILMGILGIVAAPFTPEESRSLLYIPGAIFVVFGAFIGAIVLKMPAAEENVRRDG